MKGDFSRDTFDPKKHYNAVLMQQGRVQLDADWNEQRAIDRYRNETGAYDLIGPSGGQASNAGFEIGVSEDGKTLSIGPGNLYVEGILCQNEAPVLFEEQPDLPGTKAIERLEWDLQVGLVYLDVWERHITGLEDEGIREAALGGPDTATRGRTVWQAKMLPIQAYTSANIPALRPLLEEHVKITSQLKDASGEEAAELRAALAWMNGRVLNELGVNRDGPFEYKGSESKDPLPVAHPPSTGRLEARTLPPASAGSLCVVAPGAGDGHLENQLYRVEVHDGGRGGEATFKWSRDNGSGVTAVLGVTPNGTGAQISVRDFGRDGTPGFANGQVVELLDDGAELTGQPGRLMPIVMDPARRTITVAQSLPEVDPDSARAFHYKLRRWDSPGAVPIPAEEGAFVELEGGIQVQFTGGQYNTGDYWLIPARTATGGIEWPENQPQPPAGMRHHYARLALVMAATMSGEAGGADEDETDEDVLDKRQLLVLGDCRRLYSPVTEMTSLFYLSGDGQEAGFGRPLPRPLVVGVANGDKPVPGARVRFKVQAEDDPDPERYDGELEADGKIGKTVEVTTDAKGEARCFWTLATGRRPSQQVRASLVDGTHLSVYFNANLSVAGEEIAEGIQITKLLAAGPDGQPGQEFRVDGPVQVNSLADGIIVECDPDSAIDEQSVEGKRSPCFVTVDMPYPLTSSDRSLWGISGGTNFPPPFGFQPLILAAQVNVSLNGNRIIWRPTQETSNWLKSELFKANGLLTQFAIDITELTAHLTLKGNFIWDKKRPHVYLDGDIFGSQRPGGPGMEVDFPSGDGRRGGNFEVWFRLVPSTIRLDSVTLDRGEVVGGTPQSPQVVRGTVRILRDAQQPGGATTITLRSDDSTVLLAPAGATTSSAQPISVTIPAGQSSADFDVRVPQAVTQAVGTKTVKITAEPPSGSTSGPRTVNLLVRPPTLQSLTLRKSGTAGGTGPVEGTVTLETVGETGPVEGTVTLDGPAPQGGIRVALSTSSSFRSVRLRQLTTTVTEVNVPPGSVSEKFLIDTDPTISAFAATITATLLNQQGQSQNVKRTATLTVRPPALTSVTLTPSQVFGGETSTALLDIDGPTPPGHFFASVESSDTNKAVVSNHVHLSRNFFGDSSTRTPVTVLTKPVSTDSEVTIRATRPGEQKTATLRVLAPDPINFTFDKSTISGGAAATATTKGTITLKGRAPSGTSVALSGPKEFADFPASVQVLPGSDRIEFTVRAKTFTGPDQDVTITASYLGELIQKKLTVEGAKG